MATGLENLKIYQMVKELEIEVHVLTKEFPADEKYRSVDQLRRSSSAVTNNIAEFYCKQSIKERIHILRDIAITEAEETRGNLDSSSKKGFADAERIAKLCDRYTGLIKAINGYIRFLKKGIQTDKPNNR